jgi:mono/diheme cytochrome c family protein
MERGRTVKLLLRAILAVSFSAAATAALADANSPGDAKRGEQLFAANGCGWCHANAGRTAGKGPQLAGTARDDNFIRFRITHGKEGAMPSFGAALKASQVNDLIAYIRSLKP